jgi:hypothetical protein
MDPITKAYLEVLNESVPSSEVKTELKVGAPFGDKQNEKKVTEFQKGTGPEEVEGVEKPDEASGELNTPDSSLKKLAGVKEATNPFDALFNKIVSEETFNFSTQPNNELESDNAFDDSSLGLDDSSEEDSDVDEFMDSDSEGEDVTLTLDKEMAEKLIEILQAAIGGETEEEEGEESEEGEEGEEGMEETEGEESSSDEEETYPESFALDDAEELGEPLVDIEKLSAGMNNPKNNVVSGNIKVGKKHAETPQVGKGADGKLKSHNVKKGVSVLTKKKQEVSGAVNKGKMLFDNK